MSAEPLRLAGIGDEAGSPLGVQLAALERLGWTGIELRTVDRVAVADLDERAFQLVADTLHERDMHVVAVASRIGGWARSIDDDFTADLHELAVLAERCPTLGTAYVRIMSYPNNGLDEHAWGVRACERIRVLARRAEDAGLTLLHENCAGWAGASADRMLHLLDAVDSPALQLLFDTGNGLAYGYEAHALLADVVSRVAHVHLKDAVETPDGPVYVPVGAGSARVADCVRLLAADGYRGAWSMEPHVSHRPHAGVDEPDLAAYVACGRAVDRLLRAVLT